MSRELGAVGLRVALLELSDSRCSGHRGGRDLMMGPTHRALAVTTATGLSVACNGVWPGSVHLDAAIVVVGSAWVCARLPDSIERWLRKWPLRLLRIPTDHRTWTHWLLTTVLIGVALGVLVYGLGQAVASLAAGPNGADLRHVAKGGGYVFGVLVGLGALCGTVSHALSDACTDGGDSGVPLLGPFKLDGVWLVPEPMRCKVNPPKRNRKGEIKRYRNGREKRAMTLGERCWLVGAWFTTATLIAIGVYGHRFWAFFWESFKALLVQLGLSS